MSKHTLPADCDRATFVLVKPWKGRESSTATEYVRIIREVYSNGSSVIRVEHDWQDSGACGACWKEMNDSDAVQALALRLHREAGAQ